MLASTFTVFAILPALHRRCFRRDNSFAGTTVSPGQQFRRDNTQQLLFTPLLLLDSVSLPRFFQPHDRARSATAAIAFTRASKTHQTASSSLTSLCVPCASGCEMPEAWRAESTMQLPMDGRRRVFSGAPTLRRQSVRVYKGCIVFFLKECEGLSWCCVCEVTCASTRRRLSSPVQLRF